MELCETCVTLLIFWISLITLKCLLTLHADGIGHKFTWRNSSCDLAFSLFCWCNICKCIASKQSSSFLLHSIKFIIFKVFSTGLISSVEVASDNSEFVTSPHVSDESLIIDVVILCTPSKTKENNIFQVTGLLISLSNFVSSSQVKQTWCWQIV